MNYEQSNVGPGMVPCKKGCQCSDCQIEQLRAEVERWKRSCENASRAANRCAGHREKARAALDEALGLLKRAGFATNRHLIQPLDSEIGAFLAKHGRGDEDE